MALCDANLFDTQSAGKRELAVRYSPNIAAMWRRWSLPVAVRGRESGGESGMDKGEPLVV